MMLLQRYQKALMAALVLHMLLLGLLMTEAKSERPVLTLSKENNQSVSQPIDEGQQVIKAVSVDANEVMATVNRLKQEKERQRLQEVNHQKQLAKQAMLAQQARLEEQKKLAMLKQEEEKIAILRKKHEEEEALHLKQLALQKEQEEKRIAQLKQEHLNMQKAQQAAKDAAKALEAQKALAAKQALEAQKEQEAKAARLLQEEKRQQALQAAQNAAKAAQLSGEVNRYKAMIINAISRQWILPDNVDKRLSSQFRIRLAPNGTVLEVTLIRSSGDSILDRSAQSAIFKASPLPVPNDKDMFDIFRDISLTVRPESVRG